MSSTGPATFTKTFGFPNESLVSKAGDEGLLLQDLIGENVELNSSAIAAAGGGAHVAELSWGVTGAY